MPEIVSLVEDPAWRVRRHAAWNMRLVFKNVGGSGRLFDAFLRLTEVRWVETYAHGIFLGHVSKPCHSSPCSFIPRRVQDGNFRVRRACTETIADMSEALMPSLRAGVMLKVGKPQRSDAAVLL